MRDLAHIQTDIEDANERVRGLRAELHAAWCDHHDIHIGDVVIATDGRAKLGEVRVTRIETGGRGKPWVYGTTRNKNGEWGALERRLLTAWEKPGA